MRCLSLVLVLLWCAVALAQPDYGALQEQLNANRAKWKGQNIFRYDMTISRQCFCIRESIGPFDLTVVRGRIVSVSPKNEFSNDLPTVVGLFDFIQKAIDQRAAGITVSYDPQLGYPTNVFVDQDERIADEEMGFEAKVTDFQRNPSISPVISLPPDSNGFDFKRHRAQFQKWRFQRLRSYEYRFERLCFCVDTFRGPFIITVKNNRVVNAVLENTPNREIPEQIRNGLPTITGLFRIIADEARTADSVKISYDRRRGYPTEAAIDRIKNAIDDEITFKAKLL